MVKNFYMGFSHSHLPGFLPLLQKNVQAANYVSLNPSAEAQGKALAQIIGQFNMKQTTIIIEKSKYADGFLQGVRQTVKFRKQEFFNVLPLDPNVRYVYM